MRVSKSFLGELSI